MEMDKRTSGTWFRRMLAVICVFCLCFCFLLPALAADETAQDGGATFFEKKEKYDIAVVFDNSLSMFWDEDYIVRWSRAKFAMEIFASMLNFDEGDTLTIFPMWKVTTDGSKPDVPADAKPEKYLADAKDQVRINNRKDIDKITNMFTIHADDTPFDAVENAVSYLKGKKGSDANRWLIILTDGEFDMRKGASLDKNNFNVRQEIDALKPEGIFIQYLAIDMKPGNTQFPQGDNKMFFSDSASGNGIQQKLIEICNRIFERNELPDDAINGTRLKLDLSMKKVIVFIQGNGVEIRGMKNLGNGKDANVVMDSQQRRYSDLSMGHARIKMSLDKIQTDTSLFGQVVTFSNCEAGEYNLDVAGFDAARDTLEVFYAPDVEVQTHLIDKATGKEIAEGDDVFPGEYVLQSTIVDCKTKTDVTSSPLLGNDLVYDITVTNGGDPVSIKNGDTVTMTEGEANIKVAVSYLNGKYTITNHNSKQFGGFRIVLPQLSSLKLNSTCRQPNNWYQLTKAEEWQPVHVDVTLNGEKLTDEQMQALQISYATDNGGVALSHRLLPGESAFEIDIGKDASGKFTAPEEMITTLKISASTKDEYDRELSDSAANLIEIHKHSVFWRFILAGSITGGILALLLWFMSRKVLPRRIESENIVFTIHGKPVHGMTKFRYDRKGKKLTISSPDTPVPAQKCGATFSLYAVGRRWTPSRRRYFGISQIVGPTMGVQRIILNGTTYTKNQKNQFVAPSMEPGQPINDEGTNPIIVINAHSSTLNCTTKQK